MRAPGPPKPDIESHPKRPVTADTNHEGGENQIAAVTTIKATVSGNRKVYLNGDEKNTVQKFISNYIRTTKYTAVSFLPMGLIN